MDMPQNDPVSPPSYKADDTYYWDFVTFLVEDTLFRVPRYSLITQSGSFATQYGIGGDASKKSEFVTVTDYAPANLVKLDVSVGDFKAFLKVLYPMMSLSKYEVDPKRTKPTPFQVEPSLTENEWCSVLKLSNRWHFNSIRSMAIAALSASATDLVKKANLAKEYHVKQWLLSAYKGLVQRTQPISIQEAEKLEWKNAIILFHIREADRANPNQGTAALKKKIRESFADEFARIRQFQDEYRAVEAKRNPWGTGDDAGEVTDTDEEAASTKSIAGLSTIGKPSPISETRGPCFAFSLPPKSAVSGSGSFFGTPPATSATKCSGFAFGATRF